MHANGLPPTLRESVLGFDPLPPVSAVISDLMTKPESYTPLVTQLLEAGLKHQWKHWSQQSLRSFQINVTKKRNRCGQGDQSQKNSSYRESELEMRQKLCILTLGRDFGRLPTCSGSGGGGALIRLASRASLIKAPRVSHASVFSRLIMVTEHFIWSLSNKLSIKRPHWHF